MLICLKFLVGARSIEPRSIEPKSMNTVQDLLERLGTPPPEVCMDWAWQLKKLTHAQSPQSPQPPETVAPPSSSPAPAMSPTVTRAAETVGDHWSIRDDKTGGCNWSQLTVDVHGQLHWSTSAAVRTAQAANYHSARLAQLLLWCAA